MSQRLFLFKIMTYEFFFVIITKKTKEKARMGKLKESVEDLTGAAVGPVLDVLSDIFIDGVAGSVIPGAGNMILAYKQNRMERRVEETLKMLVERQDEFNDAVNSLEDEIAKKDVEGKYFEMLMDYSLDEPQEEKIKYLVNGYINVARIPHPQEDVVRSFYDTLEQMNLLDIRVFRLYNPFNNNNDNAYAVMQDYKIDEYQYNMVREKLARLGLIYSKNDLQRDENTDAIVSYLEDLSKGKKAKLKAKKISRSESYRMSGYGNRFVKFIESEYDGEVDNCEAQEDFDNFL